MLNRKWPWMVGLLMGVLVVSSLSWTAAAATPASELSAGCVQDHVVQRGETLYRIARRYGTTYQALQRLNGLPNPNRIYASQRLCVRANTAPPDDPMVKPTPQQFIMALQTVRMRGGPGTQYAIIGRIFEGMRARVTGISRDGRWWRIICPHDSVGSCWVSADQTLTRPIEVPDQADEAIVNSIAVAVRESHPVQVVAIVRGHMLDTCGYIDTFRQFRQGNAFHIEWTTGRNPGPCAQMLTPFELLVTLDTASLPADRYLVTASNVQASFVLSQ